MAAYFKSFMLVRRTVTGEVIPLEGETLTIKKLDDTAIDSVVSGMYGFVEAVSLAGDSGDEVKFTHATYPGVFYQTLGATEEEARYGAGDATFIVQDLFTATSGAETQCDIYIRDDSGTAEPEYLGTVQPGAAADFPKEITGVRSFTLYSVPRDNSGQRRTTDFNAFKTDSLSVNNPSNGGADFGAFSFAPQTGASTGSNYLSNTHTVNGTPSNAVFPVTVKSNPASANALIRRTRNGETSDWVKDLILINGDTLQARVTASASTDTEVTATVYAPGRNAVFSVETAAGAYDTDAQAFFTATSISDNVIRDAVDQLVSDLKTANIWTKFYAIYPMVGGTASTHKYNLKNPVDSDAAFRLVFSGTWNHGSTGATPANSHADTKFNPSTHGTNWSTSNSLAFYSRTGNASSDGWVMGVGDTATGNPLFGLAVRRTGNNSHYDSGNVATGRTTFAVTDAEGLSVGSCTSSTARELYQDGATLATNTGSDTAAAPNGVIYLGALNPMGGTAYYQNHECAFAAIGQGLTDAEVTALTNAVNTFNSSLGR
jgi:hypothetical protein